MINQRCFSCSAAAHFTLPNQTVNQYFIDCAAACQQWNVAPKK
ncbi:hypothetical protein [Endozoicomonas sp. 8E]|nr:hypothetical protein [Endozoicomonas sp. 8E]WOG27928.1 hypothetical protein P6910_25865 [Endozoicomonas sp. 8E]